MLLRPRHHAPVTIVLAILAALPLAGCGRGPGAGRARQEPPAAPAPGHATGDTTRADSERAGSAHSDTAARAADTLVRYCGFRLTNEDSLRALERRLGPADFDLVLRLNRIDRGHARQGDTLVVPSVFDWTRLAPFPDTLPARGAPPRLLVVSARIQAFGAYEAGRLVRWGPTSTGRQEKPTPPGSYHANWRQRSRASTFNDEWILHWYVNLSNFDGISLHQYELPGRPTSHSCVRLLEDDAAWLYHWVDTWKLVPGDRRKVLEQGTPVVVMGEYAFGQRRPWKRLPEDPQATRLGVEEIEAALRTWGVAATESAR
jgi:lipoprotein-anchoring transpeptidase ErfK/SrfK